MAPRCAHDDSRRLDEEDLNRSLGPDNRCCFCLTLKWGSIIIAVGTFITGLIQFAWYCTSEETDSGFNWWAHEDGYNLISALDIIYLILFLICRLCDLGLFVAAFKQKSDWDHTPNLVLPWLIVNALEMVLKVVLIMMLLFSGSHKTKMTTGVYTSTLVLIGILTGLHIFCFLIIYQFRKNLIDERNLRRNRERSGNVGEVGRRQQGYLEPSAPFGPDPTTNPLLLPGDDSSSGHGPSGAKDGTRISHNRMSPPPSYDEVVFNVDYAEEKKVGRSIEDAGKDKTSDRKSNVVGDTTTKPHDKLSSSISSSSAKYTDMLSAPKKRNSSTLFSLKDDGGRARTHDTSANDDNDDGDYTHAPPQYSDAVRLPNINSVPYAPTAPSGSSTKQSEIL